MTQIWRRKPGGGQEDREPTAVSERSRAEVEAVLQGRSNRVAALSLVREAALVPVLVLLIVVGALVNPAFLTASNFSGIGQQVSALGVTVVGESLILLIGGVGPLPRGHARPGPPG